MAQKSSSQVVIPQWLKSAAEGSTLKSGEIGQAIGNQAYSGYGGPRVSGYNPQGRSALNSIYGAGNSSAYGNAIGLGGKMSGGGMGYNLNDPNYQAAKQHTGNVLSGKYMNGNSYLQGVIDKTNRGVTDNYMKSMRPQMDANISRQGAFGGSGWAQSNRDMSEGLAQSLAENESGLRYGDYQNERSFMEKAIADAMNQQGMESDNYGRNLSTMERGAAMGLGAQGAQEGAYGRALSAADAERGIQQNQYDINNQNFEDERDWLFRALQGLQGGMAPFQSFYGSKSRGSEAKGSGLAGMMGGAGQLMAGFGAM